MTDGLTRIEAVIAVPGRSGFFTDDQAALHETADHRFNSEATPLTPGFKSVRQPGEIVSVVFALCDGRIAHGDCAAVQYSGVGGREPAFYAREGCAIIEEIVSPFLTGRAITSFRELTEELRGLSLPVAVAYGVSQALLDAVAMARQLTMAEVIRDEYETGSRLRPVPMFTQCGDDQYMPIDKMIAKRADVLPHGLVNNVDEKFGWSGEIFLDYVGWVRDRVVRTNDATYHPVLHFDVYGSPGRAFGTDVERISAYLAEVERAAAPFALQIEHPIDAGSVEAQASVMREIRESLRARGSRVRLVVDEWCNTLSDIDYFIARQAADVIHVKMPDLGGIDASVEALLRVKRAGFGAYAGGTSNESDRSAQVSAHVAMACDADQVLAKPGMGVDEGLMIVGNEMARVSAIASWRVTRKPALG